ELPGGADPLPGPPRGGQAGRTAGGTGVAARVVRLRHHGGGGAPGGAPGRTRDGTGREHPLTARREVSGRRTRRAGGRRGSPAVEHVTHADGARSAAVERVAQAGEEALLAGCELARRPLLAAQLGQLPQQLLLGRVEAGRRLHVDVDQQVAPAGLVEPLHAAPVQGDDLARLRAGPDVDLLGTVEGLDGEDGAERGGRHRDLDGAVEVGTAPCEDLVRKRDDLQEQVAGRAATGADLALAGELDVGAVLDARGDAHLDRAAGADPAVAGALLARVADDAAEAAALRARAAGHDLPQEGAGDLGDLAAAVAHVAGVGVG